VSDKKIGVDANTDGTIDYYNADVTSAQDFYPFGFKMPGRQWNNGSYRYGFNGREEDDEVKGDGNSLDYKMRIYDPRIGRFLSVDPIADDYPQLTPYQFASNQPIESIDMDGMERVDYRAVKGDDGRTKLEHVSTGPERYSYKLLLWYEKGKIPHHVRVEYNGQHYIFADGGPENDAGDLPSGCDCGVSDEAINYAKHWVEIVKDPNKIGDIVKNLPSEESVRGEQEEFVKEVETVTAYLEVFDRSDRPLPGRPAKIKLPTPKSPKPSTSTNKPAVQQKVATNPNTTVQQRAATKQNAIVKPAGRAPEFTRGQTTESGFLKSGLKWLGEGYKDMGGGRYLSKDGLRQIRYGKHETSGKVHHGHFEAYDKSADQGGKVIENTRVIIVSDGSN
jgi:RHS repeat-associated protein